MITIERKGFKPDELNVASRNSENGKLWCVIGIRWVTAAQKAGFLSAPARMLDLLSIAVCTKPIAPVNHSALVVSIMKETEIRAGRYPVLDETYLILALVQRYS